MVHIRGEIDIATAGKFERAVEEAISGLDGAGDVYLDLYECSFIDSAGLQVVIRAARNLNRAGRKVRICRTSAAVRRTFELATLDELPGLSFEHELSLTTD